MEQEWGKAREGTQAAQAAGSAWLAAPADGLSSAAHAGASLAGGRWGDSALRLAVRGQNQGAARGGRFATGVQAPLHGGHELIILLSHGANFNTPRCWMPLLGCSARAQVLRRCQLPPGYLHGARQNVFSNARRNSHIQGVNHALQTTPPAGW